MKKNKLQKHQRVRILGIIFGIVLGVLFVGYAIKVRIQNFGGLYLDCNVIILSCLLFLVFVAIVYSYVYLWTLDLKSKKDDENNKQHLKEDLECEKNEIKKQK